jgi:hypothetical protein
MTGWRSLEMPRPELVGVMVNVKMLGTRYLHLRVFSFDLGIVTRTVQLFSCQEKKD